METDKQIQAIGKAYDDTVDEYNQGIDVESKLPEDFKNSLKYQELKNLKNASAEISSLKNFLDPKQGMNFLDIGSCANLFAYRLDQWGSMYYGVDISQKLVDVMSSFARKKDLKIGGMYVADMAKLPFEDNFFDIAAVIGVLEYYDLVYIEKSLAELSRVLKNNARVVIDFLNLDHDLTETMMQLETYMGRSYPKNIPNRKEIEDVLLKNFIINKSDNSGPMSSYYLTVVKDGEK